VEQTTKTNMERIKTMQIKLVSSIDNAFVTVNANETNEQGNPTTVGDVLSYDAVSNAFPDLDLDDMELLYNGEEVPEGLLSIILKQPAKDGDEYEVNAICVVDQDDDDDDEDGSDMTEGEAAPQGEQGRCTVISNGGFVRTPINIVSGVTTPREVIFNDIIEQATGMTSTQLSNCDVSQNDENRGPDSLDHAKVSDGDVIRISLRVSKEGGQR
jgi:hypothetical protein